MESQGSEEKRRGVSDEGRAIVIGVKTAISICFTVVVAAAGLLLWVDTKFDRFDAKFDTKIGRSSEMISIEVKGLGGKVDQLTERVSRLEGTLDTLQKRSGSRFTDLERRLEASRAAVSSVDTRTARLEKGVERFSNIVLPLIDVSGKLRSVDDKNNVLVLETERGPYAVYTDFTKIKAFKQLKPGSPIDVKHKFTDLMPVLDIKGINLGEKEKDEGHKATPTPLPTLPLPFKK